jgi:hypothetical protein
MMSGVGRLLLLVFLCSILSSACGEPPTNEMQQAQGAIDAARAAGAELYAHDEYSAAVDALKRANDAVADRDYRLALDNALDSRERAQNAVKLATDQKTAARSSADRAISAASRAVNAARTRLKAAESAKVPIKTLAATRKTLAEADEHVQEARTAFEAADYEKATSAATTAMNQALNSNRELEPASTATTRRRR